jgi:hypothetical protein
MRSDFWQTPDKDIQSETELSYTTVVWSKCGGYCVTCNVSKYQLPDRYIGEQRENGYSLWMTRNRTEAACRKAVEKRAREVKRGLKKSRVARTKKEIQIVSTIVKRGKR